MLYTSPFAIIFSVHHFYISLIPPLFKKLFLNNYVTHLHFSKFCNYVAHLALFKNVTHLPLFKKILFWTSILYTSPFQMM